MMKVRKNVKRFWSAVLCCAMLASMMVTGFAAADPQENQFISLFTDGATWTAGVNPSFPTGTRAIMNFSDIATDDDQHGEVVRYYHAGEATLGGVEKYKEALNYATPNKMYSVDFYLYDNTISYEFRLMGYSNDGKSQVTMGEVTINKNAMNNDDVPAKVGVPQTPGKNLVPSTTKDAAIKTWHRLDAICSKENVAFYLDGSYLGTSEVKPEDLEKEANTFNAIQVVNRAKQQATGVDDQKSGLILDNAKVQVYEKDALFYATAAVQNNEIKVSFSETLDANSVSNATNVKVYNTRTGEEVAIGTAALQSGDSLVIPVTGTIAVGQEHIVDLPADLKGISGKTIYSDVYFTPPMGGYKTYLNEDFTKYNTITQSTGDILLLDGRWNPYVNVTDTGDANHGKAATVSNTNLPNATNLRWGIKSGDKGIDITKGTAVIEFDMRIPNTNYNSLFIQPYSEIEGVSDIEHTRTDIDTRNSVDNGGRVSQYCTLSVSTATNMSAASGNNALGEAYTTGTAWMMMRTSTNQPVVCQAWGSAFGGNYRAAAFNPNEWNTVKLEISSSNVVYYMNGKKAANVPLDTTKGAQATNILRGLRFSQITPVGTSDKVADFFQIDNVKFSGPESEDGITKIRMYNLNGEEFGPMNSAGLKASAEQADIYFSGDVNVDNAVVTLTSSTQTITSSLKYDTAAKKLTAIFDGVMQPGGTYTLNVSGVKDSANKDLTATAGFVVDSDGEFVIEGLEITDADGNEITNPSAVTPGQTVYVRAKIVNTSGVPKTALLMGVAYNDTVMNNINYVPIDLENGQKYTAPIPLTVNNENDLVLKALVWEDFNSNRPLVSEYVCGVE